jgi:hypothetical protein
MNHIPARQLGQILNAAQKHFGTDEFQVLIEVTNPHTYVALVADQKQFRMHYNGIPIERIVEQCFELDGHRTLSLPIYAARVGEYEDDEEEDGNDEE